MKLVIVESPTKCQTISKYLGDEYKVMASLGHIRDLSTRGKGGLGVDVDNGFKPTYVIQPKQIKVVNNIKKEAKHAEQVILATDPDREGEAIAWHLADVLNLDIQKAARLEFHEITRTSILEAIKNPRIIDMNLVASQETRRILDRVIGFRLSNLLQKKIKSRSAGRVQSTSLKLIVDHEKEIAAFVPEEYWTIGIVTSCGQDEIVFALASVDGKPVKITDEQQAKSIISRLDKKITVTAIKSELKNKESKPPFITSTLQQEAFNRHKFSTKKTSMVAQKLYEGITLSDETVGLITYMRTDSPRLSPQFVENAEDYILANYGEKYLGHAKQGKKKAQAQVQDAHEAIRPTSLKYRPDDIKNRLSSDEYKLYSLIYYRTLASLMSAKVDEVTTIIASSQGLDFKIEGEKPVFDGYSRVLPKEETKVVQLPSLQKDEQLEIEKIDSQQHFTKAPSHYSEAKLVKLMEELGIGRPSTYASTIEILKARHYVSSDSGTLISSEQGGLTIEMLDAYFAKLIDPDFTAQMELALDDIVAGSESRQKLLSDFYDEFEKLLDNAKEQMPPAPEELTGEMCPDCGEPMVFKISRFGKFEACSNYPTCKYIKKEEKPAIPDDAPLCPDCGKPLVLRKNRRGEEFYGCSGFPKCHFIKGQQSAEVKAPEIVGKCPDCGSNLIIKKGKYSQFIGCSNYPNCHHMEKIAKK